MRIAITGIGGLIGSTLALTARRAGHTVVGVDNNARGRWFGADGDVRWRLRRLAELGVEVVWDDIRHTAPWLVRGMDCVVHCAAQPSHDFSRTHVIEDATVNYLGTLAVLEAVRFVAPEAVVIHLSTNKVYGDRVNTLPYDRLRTRDIPAVDTPWCDPGLGVNESCPIDATQRTPFGVSKTAADLAVQEYRATFGLQTTVLRGGCLTGAGGSPAEWHGFLGYLVASAVRDVPYTVYGYEGYQVRDNIDADDVATAILACAANPQRRAIYNLGGGPSHAVSMREAVAYLRETVNPGWVVRWDGPPRIADHRWWVSDTRAFQADHPGWQQRRSVWETMDAMVRCTRDRGTASVPPGSLAAGTDHPPGVQLDADRASPP